jgi:hypothetical protein
VAIFDRSRWTTCRSSSGAAADLPTVNAELKLRQQQAAINKRKLISAFPLGGGTETLI